MNEALKKLYTDHPLTELDDIVRRHLAEEITRVEVAVLRLETKYRTLKSFKDKKDFTDKFGERLRIGRDLLSFYKKALRDFKVNPYETWVDDVFLRDYETLGFEHLVRFWTDLRHTYHV